MNNLVGNGKIFPSGLIAKALRDNGYKSTDYAIAELIDNSIEAKKDGEIAEIRVKYYEEVDTDGLRQKNRIDRIAVLDNGTGMDSEVLRASLMFGNGTRLGNTAKNSIGKFGMGLPNSSFSQCKRVEVWSWQNGKSNALYTYIDIDEIGDGQEDVPIPTTKALPQYILDNEDIGVSGSLVLWSKTDRITWKKSETIIKHTEDLIGRIYRYYINDGTVDIQMQVYRSNELVLNRTIQPNDPLYLMNNTNTPSPYNVEPMFDRYGDEELMEIEHQGIKSYITLRFSYAKQSTVDCWEADRGNAPYGKHAAKNIGISILRSRREIELDPKAVLTHYEHTDRWWGCEIEFEPCLDEFFGLTNNKQTATHWSLSNSMSFKDLLEDGETIERLKENGDNRYYIAKISERVKEVISTIKKILESQTKGRRTSGRFDDMNLKDSKLATKKFETRSKERITDVDSEENTEAGIKDTEKALTNNNYPEKTAKEIARKAWEEKLKVIFIESASENSAFFRTERVPGGPIQVIVNSEHHFYKRFYNVLKNNENSDILTALHLILAAWSRNELESGSSQKERLTMIRQEWGMMVKKFLMDDE